MSSTLEKLQNLAQTDEDYLNDIAENGLGEALADCSNTGNIDAVEFLLQHGANVNASDGEPLIRASGSGHIKIAKMLLKHGADPGLSDGDALILAAENGYPEIVQLLMMETNEETYLPIDNALTAACCGTQRSSPNSNGSEEGHDDVVRLFLTEWDTVPNADAIVSAAADEHCKILELLLKAVPKESRWLQCACNKALRQACRYPSYETLKMLLSHGTVDIHTKNDQSLVDAVDAGDYEIVKMLLENGANVHARNNEPLRSAEKNGDDKIIDLLESYRT